MGIRRTKWRTTAEVPGDAEYRPLGEVGPAGTLEGPDRVRVFVDVDYPASQRGRPRVGRAVFDVALIDGTYRVARVVVDGPDDAWLDIEAMRGIRFRDHLRAGLASAVELTMRDGKRFSRANPLPDDDPLWRVALTYVTARAFNENPTVAVADDLGISPDAAAQRVKRARDAGYLPPTTPGKAL